MYFNKVAQLLSGRLQFLLGSYNTDTKMQMEESKGYNKASLLRFKIWQERLQTSSSFLKSSSSSDHAKSPGTQATFQLLWTIIYFIEFFCVQFSLLNTISF